MCLIGLIVRVITIKNVTFKANISKEQKIIQLNSGKALHYLSTTTSVCLDPCVV